MNIGRKLHMNCCEYRLTSNHLKRLTGEPPPEMELEVQ